MKKANVLIIDYSSASNLGRKLYGILREHKGDESSIHHEFIDDVGRINVERIFERVSRDNPELIFFIASPAQHEQSRDHLASILEGFQDLPVIVVIDSCETDDIKSFFTCGANDFVIPPLRESEIVSRASRLLKNRPHSSSRMITLKAKLGLRQIIGNHPLFLGEVKKIPLIAKCDTNVLITGETGTGKELCARAIHYLSSRSDMPFIPVNCGAIPNDLLENEMFGHMRGAFTSADSSQTGLIQEADGGTLFLDEIDSLSLSSQVKLLRFLQEKEYRKIGSSKSHRADVRIIAATNADLEKLVEEKCFRQDLLYRLNVLFLTLPPLRDHKEDIPFLVNHFVEKFSSEYDKEITGLSSDAHMKMSLHDWPGNVRELENTLERAVIFCEQNTVNSCDIIMTKKQITTDPGAFHEARSRVLAKFEKDYVHTILVANHGNITKAALAAQKSRRGFWELIRKHQIDVQNCKPGQL